jgi:hypothetical protein
MLDFSVYKPPAEFKVNHTTGGANAKKWSVSGGPGAGTPAAAPGCASSAPCRASALQEAKGNHFKP